MTPDQLTKVADYASVQSDRWLFIALLIVFLIAIALLTKWGMSQLDKRDVKIDALQKELGEVRKEQSALALNHAERFATIIANNTACIERNTAMSERKLNVLDQIEKNTGVKA